MIERLIDMGPFLFLFGGMVALVIWREWRLGRHWKETADAINYIDQRQKDMDGSLAGLNFALGRFGGIAERVTQLEKELQKMREKTQRRDPLDTIVREQRGIGR